MEIQIIAIVLIFLAVCLISAFLIFFLVRFFFLVRSSEKKKEKPEITNNEVKDKFHWSNQPQRTQSKSIETTKPDDWSPRDYNNNTFNNNYFN